MSSCEWAVAEWHGAGGLCHQGGKRHPRVCHTCRAVCCFKKRRHENGGAFRQHSLSLPRHPSSSGRGKATSVAFCNAFPCVFSRSLFPKTAVWAVRVKHKWTWCWQDKEDDQWVWKPSSRFWGLCTGFKGGGRRHLYQRFIKLLPGRPGGFIEWLDMQFHAVCRCLLRERFSLHSKNSTV